MVGGLVEQQHLGLAQQYFGQFNAHAPAARELFRGPLKILARKAQTRERAFDFGLIVVAPQQQIAFVLLREALHQLRISLALIIGALHHLLLHGFQRRVQLRLLGKGFAGLLAHGGVVLQLHHLWQIAHRHIVGHSNRARRGLLQPA